MQVHGGKRMDGSRPILYRARAHYPPPDVLERVPYRDRMSNHHVRFSLIIYTVLVMERKKLQKASMSSHMTTEAE